nr:MAG TPA: hypothetical protein [Caudoviricetes sp.]
MRTLIFATLLLFSFTLVGCKKKDNRPALVRANELLRKNHLPEWSSIDSIYGYEDVYNSMLRGDSWAYLRDSFRKISYQRELTAREKQEMDDFALYSSAFLKQEEIQRLEHKENGDKEEFIGYGCLMADSTSDLMTFYFIDKDFKKVQVKKKLVFVEDYY